MPGPARYTLLPGTARWYPGWWVVYRGGGYQMGTRWVGGVGTWPGLA